jgi:carbon storage regulator
MLVLSRKVGESIIINKDIKVLVLDVKGHQVKIGVQAPDGVSINREEIQDKINAQADK